MNTLKNVAILILAGALALSAQAPGSGFSLSNASTCAVPGKGVFTLCKPTTGSVQATDDGVPWPPPSSSTIPAIFSCTVTQTPQSVSSTGVITYKTSFSDCK